MAAVDEEIWPQSSTMLVPLDLSLRRTELSELGVEGRVARRDALGRSTDTSTRSSERTDPQP